ncbi:GntR family transcriptional regulator [Oceanidesulfovibrio marinus]|uniref:GntR family transcriptional regulator n=1 Tax=Oceanidesulfovibrio marinus TaxID=370038 RepID=A0A6P1ZBS5_9BACT|nr:GntR family transcriptional regulator [Oceanidesulfovibrio marinus]QJT08003.1 GntR family transcriptional regulator [Oceanidesulfovibrio marinus]TVM30613.1 hypothetical protein DQK91_20485 [Oceanidesulfovibrio marinus]
MSKELLREVAFRRFKEKLFAHTLEPGQFLSQRELSEMLDVPLAPMREAVQRLASAGLVRIIAQRGVQILEPSPQMLNEAFELRIILECAAIKTIPLSSISEQLRENEELVLRLQSILVEPLGFERIKEVLSVDWMLHKQLIQAMGNETIESVYNINADKIRLARLRQHFRAEQLYQALDEHMKVIKALLDQDKDTAAAYMELHLKNALTRGLGISNLYRGNNLHEFPAKSHPST